MRQSAEVFSGISLPKLPILDMVPALIEALEGDADTFIVQAAPGAGKTTVLPLLALKLSAFDKRKIIVLEPRRLAAKAAAERMSTLLGEKVGETVGYRVRMESKIGPNTRLEVMTEGLFLRRLQSDPELEGVGLVIFDEMHERHLDGDLALALSLQSRDIFAGSKPFKILMMSATLQSEQLQKHFSNAPLLQSEGRQFPVDVEYRSDLNLLGLRQREMAQNVSRAVAIALNKTNGSILVFLPGQAEIKFCLKYLQEKFIEANDSNFEKVDIAPLFGDLRLEEQFEAIKPAPGDRRKIVLSTDIAESSLTIEGVTAVVDGGLKRTSAFDPNTGMNRLVTERCSKASTKQRAGRAGRTQNGYCLRLWGEGEQHSLSEHGQAEILRADLSSLCLQVATWGAEYLDELEWLDTPPVAHAWQASDTLRSLGALRRHNETEDRRCFPRLLTSHHGESLVRLPMHPRLAHMLMSLPWPSSNAADSKLDAISQLAALLIEKDPLSRQETSGDIEFRLRWLNREIHSNFNTGSRQRILRSAKQMAKQVETMQIKKASPTNVDVKLQDNSMAAKLSALQSEGDSGFSSELVSAYLLLAYPDRLAKRIRLNSDGQAIYQLSNGRQAVLAAEDAMCREEFIVAIQLGGRKGQQYDRIYLASRVSLTTAVSVCENNLINKTYIKWDKQEGRFIAQKQTFVSALMVAKEPLKNVEPEQKISALLEYVKNHYLSCLNIDDQVQQLTARINNMSTLAPDRLSLQIQWPDVLEQLAPIIGPQLLKATKLADLKAIDIKSALTALLSWEEKQYLDAQLPTSLVVASGEKKPIEYTAGSAVLAVKLQEMFGCHQSPSLLNGKLPISIHLLSPAKRPLAVTQDLQSFWQNAYQEVKKEMKGRYPKHPWPDNPLEATATSKTKAAFARNKDQKK